MASATACAKVVGTTQANAAVLLCTAEDIVSIGLRVRNAAYEIIRRKGATNFAIATALTRIIEAVVRDEASVLTVSTLLDGHYGIHGVCMSLPAIIDRSGVRRVLPVPLSNGEVARLLDSAAAVKAMLAGTAIT